MSADSLRPARFVSRVMVGAFGVLTLAVLVAGCRVGPDYHRPSALGTNAMPAEFDGTTAPTNGVGWKIAEPAASQARGPWWSVFNDPELDRLENLASVEDQNLVAAAARLEQARAFVNVARSDWFPNLNAIPAYTRQRSSYNQPMLGQPAENSPTYNTFTVALQSGWELDLWGRIARQVEAARAGFVATADDVAAAQLSVQAEVATDYFALGALNAETELLQRTVEAYRLSLELTRNRRAGGIATDLDVSQAESQLKQAEALVPAVALQQAQLRHALATLCGKPATGFTVAARSSGAAIVPETPVSVPSEMLERRPDVAASERRMAAANAQVGVAQAAFYPQVRLIGLAGLQSVDAGTLFDWPSRFWAVGPAVQWPLFTGGRNTAQLAAARAAYGENVALYRQSVLVAFQEVEDQLSALSLLAVQLQAEQAALEAARRTLAIANNRYRAGLVTYLEVATAQSAALSRETAVVALTAQRLASSVALIRSLGGGWSNDAMEVSARR